MISENINLLNILTASKTERSFATIFRNSMKETSLIADSPIGTDVQLVSDSTMNKIGQLASEAENKYCSMCSSKIKEDGTCPICIVPVLYGLTAREFHRPTVTFYGRKQGYSFP